MSTPSYEGPCSDCGADVSTDKSGGAFTDGLTMHQIYGAVYLLCARCLGKSPAGMRGPGKHHDATRVKPREVT